MTGVLVLLGALAAATAFGLYRRRVDGRFRVTPLPDDAPEVGLDPVAEPAAEGQGRPGTGTVLTAADLGVPLGERATLVQFSTAFCAPCRTTRVTLGAVADLLDGVTNVEIDAESHLELVRRLGILRTPTVLVLGPDGAVVRRATGAPRKADVIAALGEIV